MRIQTLFWLCVTDVLIISCAQPHQDPLPGDQPVIVKTAPVETAYYARPIMTTGIIISDIESRLSFKTGGIVQTMYVKEGDRVRKGQKMASLNLTEINAQVQQAKENLDKVSRDYDRVASLYKDSTATREEYDNALTALHTARQTYTIATFNQDNSVICANQSGSVIKKLMNEGEIAAPGSPVYIINSTDNRDWVIHLGLTDKDWSRVRLGDHALVTTDAYAGHHFDAVVSSIGDGADPTNGTFLIKLKVDPEHFQLANGLAAKVRLMSSDREHLQFIPVDALVESDQKTGSVYDIQSNGSAVTRHIVHIAFTEGNRVAIDSGLQGIKEVITDGSSYLTPASTVKTADTH
jgi:membrane fusion protein, multidrug efflux system